MYDLNTFIEFYQSYEEGKVKADSVEVLMKIRKWREYILNVAFSQGHQNCSAITSVRELLLKRSLGQEQFLVPANFLYLAGTPASEALIKSEKDCHAAFIRNTNATGMGQSIDHLLPLKSMKDIDYAMEALCVLAQAIQKKRNPPGPATPAPSN